MMRGRQLLNLRFGMILNKHGGALAKMLPLFRLGLGGPIGNGNQFWPWIARQDACNVVQDALHQEWEGAINVVAPEQVTCKEFARTLGRTIKRTAFFKAPAFALRILIGEGSQVLTVSQRVRPSVLLEKGFQFQFPLLKDGIANNLK